MSTALGETAQPQAAFGSKCVQTPSREEPRIAREGAAPESLSLRYAESVDGSCGPKAECTKPGEVTERPKVHDWKSCVRATVPRVRIPPSPQVFSFRSRYFKPQRLWRCPRAAQSQAALSLRAMHWVPNACTEVSC